MKPRFLGILPLLFLSVFLHAAPAPVPEGFTFVRELSGISEYQLDANHLDILLLEDHSAPVVTLMVTYRVGSRNEVTGTTGATHILEHLMFKGSEHFNRDLGTSFDTLLDRIGAVNNASTWFDRTNYYEILPADQLELGIRLEADRLRGLLLREPDRLSEMTVVRNEFERGENDPVEALDKQIWAAAFTAHPYHHPTIGWRSDIEKVSIEQLRAFYDTFYWPNNATVTVIGDFHPVEALALLKKYYGAFPAAPHPIPQVTTEEPVQQGPRRVTVNRPGELGVVGIAYKVPGALHADQPALAVLASVLSEGKNSRLYLALIDTNLALSADASAGFFRDNKLFTIYARLAPGTRHEQAEQTILGEIKRVQDAGVTTEEVARAISKNLADTAYARDGSFAIAGQINEHIAIGDWADYINYPARISNVTRVDVQRVARTYLKVDQSTTGWYVPQAIDGTELSTESKPAHRSSPGHPEFYSEPKREAGSAVDATKGVPSPLVATQQPTLSSRVNRRTIAGIDVLDIHTSLENVVTLCGSLPAGDVFNPSGNSAIADLTAGMLDKGTAVHNQFELARQLESVGAEIHFGTTSQNLAFSAKCLKKDLPLVLELLAEQLRAPSFSSDEFAKLKQRLSGNRRHLLEETDYRATEAFQRAIYPEGHPNHPVDSTKYLADLEAATLEQVRSFHTANYGPTGMLLVAVGDVDSEHLAQTVGSAFAGWRGGQTLPAYQPAKPLAAAAIERVAMPGKASVSIIIGQPSLLKYNDPDRLALHVATEIFGGGYFSARLLDAVRNREGLTYGIGARLAADSYTDGQWFIHSTFAPELLAKGIAATNRELSRFTTEGVSASELETFKNTVSGNYKIALATSEGLAENLLAAVQRGLPLSFLDDYPGEIASLKLQQVNDAVKKHLSPDKMITVLAGTLPEKD